MHLRESTITERIGRVQSSLDQHGIDVLLLSVGSDLPYLTGYRAMASERLTMLVVPRGATPTLVIPRLEAPRVEIPEGQVTIRAWDELDDPVGIVAGLAARPGRVAVGDTMWARFLVGLLGHWPEARYSSATELIAPLRMRKSAEEIAALAAAGAGADRVAAALQGGEIALVGRTEAEVSAELSRRLLDEGHDVVNFAIVAAGGNAGSPHHEPGTRRIAAGELVLCDFGGTMDGYCSDITRCVATGELPSVIEEAYAVLHRAQAAGVAAATVGTPCEDVDRAAREIITEAGWGGQFIHRTGHGIGTDGHEDPYIVAGNTLPLEPGHAFSVEPGIYLPGEWGMRLEDIVVATEDGPQPMNRADHALVHVDA